MSVRPRKPAQVSLSKAAAYDTILRPIITEKATMANENGQVTFAVPVTATKPEIKAAYKATNNGKEMTAEFRADLYEPLIQLSEYTVPVREPLQYKAATCEEDEDCSGEGTLCVYGKCSRKLKVLPPDFTFNELRSVRDGTELQDLYRIVAHGIQGSGMPAWKLQGIGDKDLWALSYYVHSLSKLKDTGSALELKKRLKAQE